MSDTVSILNVTAPGAEQQLEQHGQTPRALLIDTRSKPDTRLHMTWREQYRHDPKRWLDVGWLQAMGYSVLVLTAGSEAVA